MTRDTNVLHILFMKGNPGLRSFLPHPVDDHRIFVFRGQLHGSGGAADPAWNPNVNQPSPFSQP
jgi:hypothetical protein